MRADRESRGEGQLRPLIAVYSTSHQQEGLDPIILNEKEDRKRSRSVGEKIRGDIIRVT